MPDGLRIKTSAFAKGTNKNNNNIIEDLKEGRNDVFAPWRENESRGADDLSPPPLCF